MVLDCYSFDSRNWRWVFQFQGTRGKLDAPPENTTEIY